MVEWCKEDWGKQCVILYEQDISRQRKLSRVTNFTHSAGYCSRCTCEHTFECEYKL